MFEAFANFLLEKIADFWYIWIFVLMTIDSWWFIPFPSEAVMIPAWYLHTTWEMNIYLAFLAWTLWSVFWAIINYYLWKKLWAKVVRSIISKFWKYVFIKVEDYEKTEKFFQKHWSITTFNFRFLPWVRQLISLPAWVFQMDFKKFVIYSTLWTWIWNAILLFIWYIAWENKELISQYSKEAVILTLILIFVISVIYYIFNKYFFKIKN